MITDIYVYWHPICSTHFWCAVHVHKQLAKVHNDTDHAPKCTFNPDPIWDQKWNYMDPCPWENHCKINWTIMHHKLWFTPLGLIRNSDFVASVLFISVCKEKSMERIILLLYSMPQLWTDIENFWHFLYLKKIPVEYFWNSSDANIFSVQWTK